MARLQLSESQSYLSMQLDCERYIRNLKSKHAHAYFFTKLAAVYFLLRFPQPYEGCANLQGCACLAHACACLRLEPLRACAIAHLQAWAIIPRMRACTLNRALAQSYLGCGSARLIACLQSCAILFFPQNVIKKQCNVKFADFKCD